MGSENFYMEYQKFKESRWKLGKVLINVCDEADADLLRLVNLPGKDDGKGPMGMIRTLEWIKEQLKIKGQQKIYPGEENNRVMLIKKLRAAIQESPTMSLAKRQKQKSRARDRLALRALAAPMLLPKSKRRDEKLLGKQFDIDFKKGRNELFPEEDPAIDDVESLHKSTLDQINKELAEMEKEITNPNNNNKK